MAGGKKSINTKPVNGFTNTVIRDGKYYEISRKFRRKLFGKQGNRNVVERTRRLHLMPGQLAKIG